MGAVARVLIVFAAYLMSVLAALITDRRGLPRVAASLWLLTTISVGAYMFLLGQLFNYTLTFWQAPFLWMTAALAMGYARNSKAHGMIVVPLGLLALGWFGGGSGWFMDDQVEFLVSSGGLRPIMPFIGVGLIAIALLTERVRDNSLDFLHIACRLWGGFLIATPLILTTIDEELVEFLFEIYWSTKQIVIVGLVFALIGAVIAFGRRQLGYIMLGFSAVLLIMQIRTENGAPLIAEMADIGALYVFLVAVIFALAMAAASFGARLNSRMMVNFGVTSGAILVFIQYFSWSFVLLDRSLAFIVGGILLIVTAIFLERQRRTLIARIAVAPEGEKS